MQNTIEVRCYLNDEDEIISNHKYKVVDRLDEHNVVIDIEVEKDKVDEIKLEARNLDGFYETYGIEYLEWFRDGNEIKYGVSVWCPFEERKEIKYLDSRCRG